MPQIGKILIISGVLLTITGILVFFWGNKLSWLGHLPGDIRIEREELKFYFPITTMILLSAAISIIIKIFQKFMH